MGNLTHHFSCWQVDFMRREKPSETITTVDTEADGILESTISAKESSETVTTADMETGMLDSFVKTKELLEKIKTMDNDATGTSAWKNEEDSEEFENKSFPFAAFIYLSSSSSDEVEFISNRRESRDALSAAADVNKKKKKKKIEAESVVRLFSLSLSLGYNNTTFHHVDCLIE